jgi:hypothetical protein
MSGLFDLDVEVRYMGFADRLLICNDSPAAEGTADAINKDTHKSSPPVPTVRMR